MDKEHIKELIDRYFEGETTLEEERLLKRYFEGQNIADELKEYKEHFLFFVNSRKESTDSGDDVFAKIDSTPTRFLTGSMRWVYGVAAGLTLLLVGFAAGRWTKTEDSTKGQIASLQSDVQEMKKLLTISNLQQASASERIKVVNQSTSLSEANNDIIFALLSTLNSDINVNVRLASCEALYKWKDEPLVRKGLITSLGNQSDPAVQITIIHMLVEMKEKQAIPEIRKLVQSNQVLKIVKTNAEQGIARLL
jgi:hypothetical protein